jgi:hypothetical protein
VSLRPDPAEIVKATQEDEKTALFFKELQKKETVESFKEGSEFLSGMSMTGPIWTQAISFIQKLTIFKAILVPLNALFTVFDAAVWAEWSKEIIEFQENVLSPENIESIRDTVKAHKELTEAQRELSESILGENGSAKATLTLARAMNDLTAAFKLQTKAVETLKDMIDSETQARESLIEVMGRAGRSGGGGSSGGGGFNPRDYLFLL